MDKIYLVIVDIYNEAETDVVNICTTREKAEELIAQYNENGANSFGEDVHSYHIDEVELDSSKDVLWDCYENPYFKSRYGNR